MEKELFKQLDAEGHIGITEYGIKKLKQYRCPRCGGEITSSFNTTRLYCKNCIGQFNFSSLIKKKPKKKLAKFWLDEVSCHDCGISLEENKAQEVKTCGYHPGNLLYFCEKHKKPFDKASFGYFIKNPIFKSSKADSKFFKEFQVNEKGKIIKQEYTDDTRSFRRKEKDSVREIFIIKNEQEKKEELEKIKDFLNKIRVDNAQEVGDYIFISIEISRSGFYKEGERFSFIKEA